ncbi:MAG: DUF3794 domain-containing protein [Peptococcaceae bacterium]|nr:DUF3794 domain-containing protein [Peptococcaceae bacterium]
MPYKHQQQLFECREFVVRQVVGEQTRQTNIRTTMTIPSRKPPAEQVLDCNVSAKVTNTEILRNKVVVEGKANVKVTYVAKTKEGDQPVHAVHGDVTFTEFLDIPGAEPGVGQDVFVRLTVEQARCELDHNDRTGRKIIVTIIIRIFAKVTVTEELELLVQTPEGTIPLPPGTEPIELVLNQIVGQGERQVVISETVNVKDLTEGCKPCPEQVVDTICDAAITRREVIDGKVVLEGMLTLQVIYVARTWEGDQPVHHVHVEIPFSEFVEVPGAEPDDIIDVSFEIEDCEAVARNICDLRITAVLALRADILREMELVAVTAPEVGPVAPGFEAILLRTDRIVGDVAQQIALKDTLVIPAQKPPAQKVLECMITSNTIQQTEVLEAANKVLVRGAAEVKITYVADKPTQPVHAFHTEVPWNISVAIPGDVTRDDIVTVNINSEFCSVELVGENIDFTLILGAMVRVTRIVQENLVICVEEVPAPADVCPPGTRQISYTIKAGDTLFALAQRFRTTVDQIMAVNPGINPNNLQVGQVITICEGGLG